MTEPKFKLGDDGELEEIIEDFDEKPKRKRKPKPYNRTIQVPLSLILIFIVGVALFGLVAFYFSRPSQPQSLESISLTLQFRPTDTHGGILDRVSPCAMFPVDQKPRIVYSVGVDNSDQELLRVNVDGSNNCILTRNNVYDGDPSWSPDGTRIVYNSMFSSAGYGFDNQLYIMNANGENITKLTRDFSAVASPDWSPDGKRIIFEGVMKGKDYYQLFTINTDGNDIVNLTNATRNDTDAKWSPDGQSIVFVSSPSYDEAAPAGADQSKKREIFVMNADGGNLRQLTDNTIQDSSPSWSLDGEWIAFERADNIFIMGKNGKRVRRVTDDSDGAFTPFWLANGTEIGYTTYGESIQIINIDAGQTRFIPISDWAHSVDSWFPLAASP